MNKRMLLALALILCLMVLCACQSGEPQRFQPATMPPPQNLQNLNMGAQAQPTNDEIDFDDGSYDPMSEEEYGDSLNFDDVQGSLSTQPTEAPTVRSEYAGATPVIIDPIDKPTPTPVPPITFTYQVYEASRLRLTFEGPAGWIVDDTANDTFTLRNPDPSVDYAADLVIRMASVSSNMNESDLTREVKGMLDTIKSQDLKSFSPSNTAKRDLLGESGVYANYTATLPDGTEIAGRVHAVCVNKTLYTVHVSYPRAYTNTYVDGVYTKLRHTLEFVQ